MSASVDWAYLDAGHYRASYQGRTLEIKRNPDGADARRYIVEVDGEVAEQPCWQLNQAKTKAMRWVQKGADAARTLTMPAPKPIEDTVPYDPEPAPQEMTLYEAPPPADTDDYIELPYTITGVMRVPDFGNGWSHLRSTVEMLRELGPAEGEARPPARVKL